MAGRTKEDGIDLYGYSETATKVLPLGADGVNRLSSLNPLPTGEISPLDIRFDPTSDEPIYIGLNYLNYNADTSSNNWVIYKLTTNTRVQMRKDVAWDNRTSLF
jgi:hypothetical protein